MKRVLETYSNPDPHVNDNDKPRFYITQEKLHFEHFLSVKFREKKSTFLSYCFRFKTSKCLRLFQCERFFTHVANKYKYKMVLI